MTALTTDLDDRGLLETPPSFGWASSAARRASTATAGRDHWARCWSVVVGGAGMKGGIAVGKTNEDGTEVETEPLHLARRDGHDLQVAAASRSKPPSPAKTAAR